MIWLVGRSEEKHGCLSPLMAYLGCKQSPVSKQQSPVWGSCKSSFDKGQCNVTPGMVLQGQTLPYFSSCGKYCICGYISQCYKGWFETFLLHRPLKSAIGPVDAVWPPLPLRWGQTILSNCTALHCPFSGGYWEQVAERHILSWPHSVRIATDSRLRSLHRTTRSQWR